MFATRVASPRFGGKATFLYHGPSQGCPQSPKAGRALTLNVRSQNSRAHAASKTGALPCGDPGFVRSGYHLRLWE